jgi:hypothetical protein
MFFSIFKVYSEIVFEKFFFHFVFLSSRGLKIGLKHVILSNRHAYSAVGGLSQTKGPKLDVLGASHLSWLSVCNGESSVLASRNSMFRTCPKPVHEGF